MQESVEDQRVMRFKWLIKKLSRFYLYGLTSRLCKSPANLNLKFGYYAEF